MKVCNAAIVSVCMSMYVLNLYCTGEGTGLRGPKPATDKKCLSAVGYFVMDM